MKATFENATIADSFGKAARIAPRRGAAFDKASGIIMELDEEDQTVNLKATNLEVYYLEVVDAVKVEGTGIWRFPADLTSSIVGKLPIGTGKEVSFSEDDSNVVLIESGRMRSKVRKIDPTYYPNWEPFDPDLLDLVPDLGGRIQQVEWAAMEGGEPPFSGVHISGTQVIATDRIRMACAPCETPLVDRPITVPAGILKPVMRSLRDVAIGVEEGQFLLMPNPSTQIRTVIFDKEFPNIERAMRRDHEGSISFKKQELLDIIDRAMVFGVKDRSPKLSMHIGKGEVAVTMSDEDMGLLQDFMELPGQADHKRVNIFFTPKNLIEALNAAPSENVKLGYNLNGVGAVRVDGGSGYEAWVMPRNRKEDEE